MLKSISIKNIALISQLNVDFSDGLNIITGETGAGKSIIIDSINLALGERAGRELIKTGESRGSVEAVFSVSESLYPLLDEAGIEPCDGEIIISRDISLPKAESQNIKSVCRVNGTMISLSELKALTEHMVDVHGQHEHQSLLSQSRHMGILDAFSPATILPLKNSCAELFSAYRKIRREMNSGFVSEQEREQRMDILTYQLNEIDAVAPEAGEDERLDAEIELLANGERIMQALYSASSALSNGEHGALTCAKSALNDLYPITAFSTEYKEIADALSESYYALEAAADQLRSAADGFSFDAKRLDEAQGRSSAISTLKRKYGNSIEAVLEFAEKARTELDDLRNSEKRRAQLAAELEKTQKQYESAAQKLTEIRRSAAAELKEKVEENLKDLGLGKSVFEVYIADLEGEVPSADGKDYVEFMFSANPGEPKKPLRKVASGGEMSRIMLALKNVLADTDDIDTLIFDEIDTGISGNAATVVGMKMSSIARKKQVLAITHLPQIAAFADSHYLVEKLQGDDVTTSTLSLLTGDDRVREVARIMGGADSELALRHAAELIANAKK